MRIEYLGTLNRTQQRQGDHIRGRLTSKDRKIELLIGLKTKAQIRIPNGGKAQRPKRQCVLDIGTQSLIAVTEQLFFVNYRPR